MKGVSEITACVVDTSGNYLPLARKLGESYKRVLYHIPNWQKGSPSLNDSVVGYGFPEVEWCEDFWTIKSEIDLFIFPDLNRIGEQLELRSQGFPVWCAGNGMALENNRQFFLRELDRLGLEVPKFKEINGLTELADFLKDKEDIWIKLSKWRGSWETYHWRSWKQDAHRLHYWHVRFGPFAEQLRFLCFEKIDTKLEIGVDTFSVLGRWPERVLFGLERKDTSYFSAVTPWEKLPKQMREIMDKFSEFLEQQNSVTQWSMEVRVTENDLFFFLDPTPRGGLPSTASQCFAMKNLPKVIYAGAQGVLIQPEYAFEFTAECMVSIHGYPHSWETIVFPNELKPHLMVSDCCQVNEQVWFPADEEPTEEIAWLVCGGQTPTECAEEMNRLSDLLPDGSDAAVEGLHELIREAQEMSEKGIPFSEQPLPKPEIVLEPT